MSEEYLHITLGSCRYATFSPGQLVEISPEGYEQGIHEFHIECFGYVEFLKNGILTVKIFGSGLTREFHPCYWTHTTQDSLDNWKKEKIQLDIQYTT